MDDDIIPSEVEDNEFKIINYSVSWIPLITMTVALFTIIFTYFLFIINGDFSIDSLPTFSETARMYPISKIFAVGISCFAFLFYVSGTLFVDFLSNSNYSNSKFMRTSLPIISVFFIITACVNKNDQPDVHGCFSCLSFLFILLFGIWSYRALKTLSLLRYSKIKAILLIIGAICSILIVVTAPFKNMKSISILEAIVEYVMVISLFLYYGMWYFDFKYLQIDFYIAKTYINEQ